MTESRRPSLAVRRRIARATATWGALTLGAVAVLAALIIWHLIRRGRLIRQSLSPPRDVRLPEVRGEGPPANSKPAEPS